jgi:hypothetical protein
MKAAGSISKAIEKQVRMHSPATNATGNFQVSRLAASLKAFNFL